MLITISCSKNLQEPTNNLKNDFTTSVVRRYYDSLKVNQKVRLSKSVTTLENYLTPNWEDGVKSKSGKFNTMEVPIFNSKRETNLYQLNEVGKGDDKLRANFSFSRLLFYATADGRITSNIITYIPDEKYIKNNNSLMSKNKFNNLDKSFYGFLEYKDINGIPKVLLRIENGIVVHKYIITPNSSLSKSANTAAVTVENGTLAVNCHPMCIPIYRTICTGIATGTGFEEDWTCETFIFGESCYYVCDGEPDVPLPGDPGTGPGSTPIFGENGSNAMVSDASFPQLLDYIASIGLQKSDTFSATLTFELGQFEGKVTEIYDSNGKVVVAYFRPNEGSSTFPAGFNYAIGNGNNDASSPDSESYYPQLGYPVVDPFSSYTNGHGSIINVAFESDPNLTDGDPDIYWWNDNTTSFPTQNLPTWANMNSNYPKDASGGDLPGPQVYSLVGGAVLNLYNSNPSKFQNGCALRVSRALNYSGVTIPAISGQTWKGSDNKNYFLSSAHLYNFMKKTFGSGNIILNQSDGGTLGQSFQDKLSGNKGIYIMEASYPARFGALGHATLFNGSIGVGGHTYFNAPGGVNKITLWKLQ